MAGFEHKPNSGTLFNNERKEAENHPDRTGAGLLECPHCGKSWATYINGWLKKKGTPQQFLSLSFKPKDQQQRGAPQGQGGGGQSRPQQAPQSPQGTNQYAQQRSGGQSGAGGPPRTNWDRNPDDDAIPFAPDR